MTPVEARLRQILVPEMLATDIAEYLVRKGLPFRETHHIAGQHSHVALSASDITLYSLILENTPFYDIRSIEIDCSFYNQYLLYRLGAAVKLAENKGVPLDKLTLEDLKTLDPKFEADVMNLWSYENR